MEKITCSNFIYILLLIFTLFPLCSTNNKHNLKITLAKEANQGINTNFAMLNLKQNQTYDFLDGNANFYVKTSTSCDENNCQNPYGTCMNNNTCACNPGYTQDYSTAIGKNNPICSYEMKKQAYFLLLEMIFWIGGGHFYAGRYLYGGLKAGYIIFIIILDCLTKIPLKRRTSSFQRCWYIFMYFLYFGMLAWQLFDVIMIGLNNFKDGNNMYIYTWDTHF